MNTQGYGKYIKNQIQNWSDNEPITIAAVAASLAGAFGIDINNAKKITNVNMKRLFDRDNLARIQKGVYCKVKATPFGKLAPSIDEVMSALLLRDGDKTMGYIAGPTLLNEIGLCSWTPKERHIVTNSYRRRIPKSAPIRVYKPVITVNNENAPYLQALEALTVMEKYPVDAYDPDEIMRGMLRKNRINNERLIWYARNHFGQKTLLKTIDIALKGFE
jgi:hypothetical protein